MQIHSGSETIKLSKLTAEKVRKINSSEVEPHVHDFEELIIVNKGKLEHFIDFKTVINEAPLVSFITKGKVHKANPILTDNDYDAWLIRFNSDFIPELTFQLYSFYHLKSDIQFSGGRCFDRLNILCELMQGELSQPKPDLAVVRHLLSALLIMIESERNAQAPEKDTFLSSQNQTFKNFLQLLEENFKRPVGVEFYADKLFMTARNLNHICQSILQQSVSAIIETRKLIEAKSLLASGNKTIAEIGYELGYQEKSYFTAVFKKKAGMTPTEFRKDIRKRIS